MSDMGDMMIDYEADNWNELAEEFIEHHRSEWESFIEDKFRDYLADRGDR